MRAATPLWKVFARAIGAVVLVFALVIGVLAVFGDDSQTQATSVQAKGTSATSDTSAPTSTAPVTATPTTAPPEATPIETTPPAPASGGNSAQSATPQAAAPAPTPAPAPAPAPTPAPPTPTNPPPPPLNPRVIASGAGTQVNVTLIDFPPNSTIAVTCGWLKEGVVLGETQTSATTNASGQGNAVCGPAMSGSTHGYAVANGIHSNHASL